MVYKNSTDQWTVIDSLGAGQASPRFRYGNRLAVVKKTCILLPRMHLVEGLCSTANQTQGKGAGQGVKGEGGKLWVEWPYGITSS